MVKDKKTTVVKISSSLALSALLLPNIAKAVDIGLGIPNGNGGTTTHFTSYVDYVRVVFKFALEAGVALTVLMVIYAGIIYITSSGNQSALGSAKDIMIGSLSGLAMLAVIVLILTVLGMPVF